MIAEFVAPPLLPSTPQTVAAVEAPLAVLVKPPFTMEGPLFPPLAENLYKRRIVIRSFSSMSRHHLSLVGAGASFGEQAPVGEDEAAPPVERDDPLRGPVFGDMVHKVLEQIDFAEVARAADADALLRAGTHARRLIDREVLANLPKLRTRTPLDQLAQACRQQIAQLVWCALRTPLSGIGRSLSAIPAADRLAEVEFMTVPAPPSRRSNAGEGFVTGFMDLLFRKDGQLLDWKTYGQEQLERAMADADYHRQYRLYLQAVSRWLRRVKGPTFRFLDHCGGVYYLFVRGLNGRDDTTGVFFHRPTIQDLDLEYVLKH